MEVRRAVLEQRLKTAENHKNVERKDRLDKEAKAQAAHIRLIKSEARRIINEPTPYVEVNITLQSYMYHSITLRNCHVSHTITSSPYRYLPIK